MLEILKKEAGPTNIKKMTIPKFNKTETILTHIDIQIIKWISEGKSLDMILSELHTKLERFEITINNITNKSETRYKYLYTHNQVCRKRIFDIMYAQTLMSNYNEYAEYSYRKIFNLIKFRDKIIPNKFVVEVPE
jgi:hypothetical protein